MNYFNTVVQLLTHGVIIYKTTRHTYYYYAGIGTTHQGEQGIRYTINGNPKLISQSLLNSAKDYFNEHHRAPNREWYRNNFESIAKHSPCTVSVILSRSGLC